MFRLALPASEQTAAAESSSVSAASPASDDDIGDVALLPSQSQRRGSAFLEDDEDVGLAASDEDD